MDASKKIKRGITVKDVPADVFIKTLAKYLKNNSIVEMPAWGDYCKTAACKELSPLNPDWYFIRAGF